MNLRISCVVLPVLLAGTAVVASGQTTPDPQTRQGQIESAQAEKGKTLVPANPSKSERAMNKAEDILINGNLHWYPFFDSAYQGGGFAAGFGYRHHVSSYNLLAGQGSYSIRGYQRVEAEFKAPRIFQRRGELTVVGGYRKATQVPFFGLGNDATDDDRTNFSLVQPRASALLRFLPTRKYFELVGGVEWTRIRQESGEGSSPSVETRYTPATLPGLNSEPEYLHTQTGLAIDWRPSKGYARRGGYYGVEAHDFHDRNDLFGFRRIDYELIQHLPVLREAWVLSFHAAASVTQIKSGQDIPFYMLPWLGGGTTLRGYGSFRFRDRNSLLLQAEWRIMNNRFFDSAFFYDTGKVTARTRDLGFDDLKSDFGFGVRFHGPISTPLRVDLARSKEGFTVVFATSHVF
jgi:hypothetical protein